MVKKMAETDPLAPELALPPPKTITDLELDAHSRCSNNLSLEDISLLAMSSKYLKTVAYSDSIWLRFFREQWPQVILPLPSGVRDAFLSRRTALLQFNFLDPAVADFSNEGRPVDHLLLDQIQNAIFFYQGSVVRSLDVDSLLRGRGSFLRMGDHTARITCMRFQGFNSFSLFITSLHSILSCHHLRLVLA